jgi:uncharacterized protein YxeA
MKKHDEGYVLAYVTVVLLLFCLIATMILTGAMKNLTIQQDTVQHMKDRYAAEGMIQQVIVQWTNYQWESYEEGNQLDTDMPDVIFLERNGEYVKLSATSNSVVIVCEVNKDGEYQYFNIGTVPEQSEAGEGEVSE